MAQRCNYMKSASKKKERKKKKRSHVKFNVINRRMDKRGQEG